MDELINRIALRDALYDADAVTMEGVKIIHQFPAVDAVEVVRCSECVHYHRGYPYGDEHIGTCGLSDGQLNFKCDYDFCSWGERGSNEA